MATYKVRYYRDVYVEDVTNENIAVLVANNNNTDVPSDFSVSVELISE